MNAITTKTVDTPHLGYVKFSGKWKRCRDVVAGQDEVHAATVAYLPRLKDQSDDDYAAMVKRAGFYNATWRTISGLLGMLFRKPPMLDVPGGIKPHLDDIDMAGHSFDNLARNTACEILEVGRIGILVDHPPKLARNATIAEAERLGIRPSMQVYKAESILNWRHRRISNRWMLCMVVLREEHSEPDGEWAETTETRFRVLDLDDGGNYRQRVFRVKDGKDEQIGGDIYPLMNNKPLEFIPFWIVGTDGVDASLDEPPLIDLVDLNLHHYRVTADYEHGCHFTGLPTAVVSGYTSENGEKLYIGSTTAWIFPDPNAKATFLEFTGQGLDALKGNLDRKEQQMAILGARMLAEEKRTAETATTAAIHRTGENSVLSAIAIAVSDALEEALTMFSEWAGQQAKVEFAINRDFLPVALDAQQLTALFALKQGGGLSDAEFFELLQRGDVIDSTKKLETHQGEIDNAPPPAPTQQAANDTVTGAAA